MGEKKEKYLMEDLLLSQKMISQQYHQGILYAENESIHHQWSNLLQDEHKISMELLQEQVKRGWYTMEPVEKQEKLSLLQEFTSH